MKVFLWKSIYRNRFTIKIIYIFAFSSPWKNGDVFCFSWLWHTMTMKSPFFHGEIQPTMAPFFPCLDSRRWNPATQSLPVTAGESPVVDDVFVETADFLTWMDHNGYLYHIYIYTSCVYIHISSVCIYISCIYIYSVYIYRYMQIYHIYNIWCIYISYMHIIVYIYYHTYIYIISYILYTLYNTYILYHMYTPPPVLIYIYMYISL